MRPTIPSQTGTHPKLDRPNWLPASEFPFTSRWLKLDGHWIHYMDEGAGPALLFVHPGPLWSFIFRDVIVRLREQFRCIALDFPGSGLSVAASGLQPSLPAASEILERFVDTLAIGPAVFVVHDVGGPVGLGLATRRPELVEGLVVTNAFAWPLVDHPLIVAMLRFVGGPVFRALNTNFNVLARVSATRYGAGRWLSRRGEAALRGPFTARVARRYSTTILRSALTGDTYLRELEQGLWRMRDRWPVLLIFSKNDPGHFRARFERMFASVRSLIVLSSSHFPTADDPERFADTVRSWWHEQAAPTTSRVGKEPGVRESVR